MLHTEGTIERTYVLQVWKVVQIALYISDFDNVRIKAPRVLSDNLGTVVLDGFRMLYCRVSMSELKQGVTTSMRTFHAHHTICNYHEVTMYLAFDVLASSSRP